MTLAPRVGWLLSYNYLWADDHRRGAEEGVKNRPCALVAATRRDGDRIVAIVTPVTHSPPADLETAIEIPAVTKARLGLDAQRSWIICNEANVFAWPGPDLRAARKTLFLCRAALTSFRVPVSRQTPEASRIKAVRLSKHFPCRTAVAQGRP